MSIAIIVYTYVTVIYVTELTEHDSLNYAYNLVWSVTIRLLMIVIHCIYKTFLIATDIHKKKLV